MPSSSIVVPEVVSSSQKNSEPSIERSITLHFVGDWGQANFHRICSWLTQAFCDRAGPRSRVGIWSIRSGGIEALYQLHDGEVDLCIATPAGLMATARTGTGIFAAHGPMPGLRALAVLPQRDRLMLAVHPKFGVKTWEDIRRVKPPFRLATSIDDGTNFIGYVAMRLLKAHGIDEETLKSWGGSLVLNHRPEHALFSLEAGESDAVLQEAIMTPWWREAMEKHKMVPIQAEPEALNTLSGQPGFEPASIRGGFWDGVNEETLAVEFSDFVVFVRDDMPDDVAHLLTWCLVETRADIERQYAHIPSERSPLSYPLVPSNMAKTPVPLHPGAERYYEEAGYL